MQGVKKQSCPTFVNTMKTSLGNKIIQTLSRYYLDQIQLPARVTIHCPLVVTKGHRTVSTTGAMLRSHGNGVQQAFGMIDGADLWSCFFLAHMANAVTYSRKLVWHSENLKTVTLLLLDTIFHVIRSSISSYRYMHLFNKYWLSAYQKVKDSLEYLDIWDIYGKNRCNLGSLICAC